MAAYSEAHKLGHDSDELRAQALDAVAFGQSVRLPFAHFSKGLVAPHRFARMARETRGEKNLKPQAHESCQTNLVQLDGGNNQDAALQCINALEA